MFQQLKSLLEESKLSPLKQSQVGRAMEILKSVSYFSDLDDKYGTEYLVPLFPALEAFILRERLTIFNFQDDYVLMEGTLTQQMPQSSEHNEYPIGDILQIKQKSKAKIVAITDCKMIRIRKKYCLVNKISKRLLQIQVYKNKKKKQLQNIIKGDESNMGFYKEIKEFTHLGEYDALEMMARSEIKLYPKGALVYSYGENINKIGYILSGKVKLIYNKPVGNKHQIVTGTQFSISYCQGQWLCLEELFSQQNIRSKCEVNSIEVRIYWIPKFLFQQKVSQKLNYELYHQFQKYVTLKRMLLNKNKNFSIISNEYKIKSSVISERLLCKLNQLESDDIKTKRMNKINQKSSGKKYQIPSEIVHRNSLLYTFENMPALPKLSTTNITFAQEYQQFLNNLQYTSEIMKKEEKVKQLYALKGQDLMINTIKKPAANPENQYNKSFSCLQNKHKEAQDIRCKIPSNHSIYNNFRVRSLQSKMKQEKKNYKTLTIFA